MLKQSNMIKPFIEGFIKGARETPRAFFAPAIAIWHLLWDTTESLVDPKRECRKHKKTGIRIL